MSLLHGVLSGIETYDAPTLFLTDKDAGRVFISRLQTQDAYNENGLRGVRSIWELTINPYKSGTATYFHMKFAIAEDSAGLLYAAVEGSELRQLAVHNKRFDALVTELGDDGMTARWGTRTHFLQWRPTKQARNALSIFLDRCEELGFV